LVVYLSPEGRRGTVVTHGFHEPQELARIKTHVATAGPDSESITPPSPAPLPKVDLTPLVAAYHGPRLAITAADIEGPSSFHMQFPDVPVKKIHGAGHWLMMDKPGEFNALLDEFLATVPR